MNNDTYLDQLNYIGDSITKLEIRMDERAVMKPGGMPCPHLSFDETEASIRYGQRRQGYTKNAS